MLYLKALNTADTRQEYQFFQEIQSESGFLNPYHGISYSDFVHQAVPERIDASRGIGVAEGLVPDTYFFLWEDRKIVGLFKIRHYLNDFFKKGLGSSRLCHSARIQRPGLWHKGSGASY